MRIGSRRRNCPGSTAVRALDRKLLRDLRTMWSQVLNRARPSNRPMLRATASNVSCEASSASWW